MGYIYKINLTVNMRVIRNKNNPDASTFTKFLLDAGENNINLERILNTNTFSNHLIYQITQTLL